MMKKILSLALAIMLVLSLAACSGATDRDDDNDRDNDSDRTSNVDGDDDTDHAGNVDRDDDTAFTAVNFQETVLVDNETCTFTIKSIETDGVWGYTLKAFLENKTDRNLMFTLNYVSVNGFMCDPFWAAQVSSGMKSNEDICFYETSLEEIGVTTVTDITFTFTVYDADDFTAGDLVSETFTIYPLGEDAVEPYVRTPAEDEIVLFENENATMIVIGQKDDPFWGYTLMVYLENRTDKTVMFSASDVAVNGFMCDPFWATEVAPGKRAICPIYWMTEEFEENSITDVETITMPISVYDINDWMADPLVDDSFTFEPNF